MRLTREYANGMFGRMPKPVKQLLLGYAYPGDLEADIKAWIAEGTSWRDMAKLVSTRSKHSITYESLRKWYGADAERIAKAAKLAKAGANTPLDFDADDSDNVAQPA